MLSTHKLSVAGKVKGQLMTTGFPVRPSSGRRPESLICVSGLQGGCPVPIAVPPLLLVTGGSSGL